MDDLSSVLSSLWDFLVYIFNSIMSLLDFISSYILDLPVFLIVIFKQLPTFVQTGIGFIIATIVLVFVMKIIKHVKDATID